MSPDLNRALRRAMETRAESQRSTAINSGVHYTTINRWLMGARSPGLHEFAVVLDALGYKLQVVDKETGEVL